ncbi:MAG: hypothetical protein ACRCZI_05810, partial [Cetobacterium sp.]
MNVENITFEQCFGISDFVAKKLFDVNNLGNYKWRQTNLSNFDIIKFLHKNKFSEWETYALNIAAENGDKIIIEWLLKNCSNIYTAGAVDMVYRCNSIETIKWLHNKLGNTNPTQGALLYALLNKNLEFIKLAYNKNLVYDAICIKHAILLCDDIEIIKFFYKNFTPDGCEIDHAMDDKKYDIVKYIYKNHKETIDNDNLGVVRNKAVEQNNLDLIQFFHDNGERFDSGKVIQAEMRESYDEAYRQALNKLAADRMVADLDE